MKIGFVLDDGLDKPDGVQQYILTLGQWYQSHGHEVRYLVGETKRTDLQNVYSLAKNIKVKFNGNALTIPLPASKTKIKQVLSKEKFDVLHVQVPYSPFMGAKVVMAAPKETRIIGTFHILPYGALSKVGTKLLGLWLRKSLRRFHGHVSVSKPAAVFAKQTFNIDSVVIPNSIHINEFRPKTLPKNEIEIVNILFLGRLVERKGCRRLLMTLDVLKQQGKLPNNVMVHICGDGDQRTQLKRYARTRNLSDQVVFHGFVSNSEKIEFMQNADIAVFPSISGESFGIVLIEAMAAGSGVVLAGNNPGYASVMESVPEALFDPCDVQKFADMLDAMIRDSTRRNDVHAKQQSLVQQFDTETVASALLQQYR